jgi:hypothetical protein
MGEPHSPTIRIDKICVSESGAFSARRAAVEGVMARDHGHPPKFISRQIRRKTSSDEASEAMRALVDLFSNLKWHGGYRRYVLERVDGELVFRQPEADAAVEAAIEAVTERRPKTAVHRRMIKLP